MPTLPRELRELQYAGQPLTQRQHEILRHLALGLTGLQTADQLSISNETIKTQLAITRSKLQANTTSHAVAIAVPLDLI